ncbi:cytochrome-c oxidase, cbb3-type subunit III [Candidatus Bandiella euplotis]|uniref:Cbb3-type cytochrome c oxidase subunit n=1 Tax=Candidatus Bandiella euplotis TaxID=1664265 RepID=A0ABZ0UMX8_9RICK|nr:cytochrome-c oxidase, cbb3-type subunit III [Candidatus Bandiella woodruffii]WPX96043.1 Cbb3-type cytochrome c oxidase subunit III [Candidatus Bandiella woodruffii]
MRKEEKEETKTTGHEWDGIKEYDTPDPFWLRLFFYGSLFFALGYWLLYPAWPVPNSGGILGWSSGGEVDEKLKDLEKVRFKYQEQFNKSSFEEVLKDKKLTKFAMAGGKSAFENNCVVCHGAGGGGNIGYPSLASGAWMWGGEIDDIYTTIKYGIRSNHDDTRDSAMAAFGKDKILTPKQIDSLTKYVMNLNNNSYSDDDANALFQQNCSSCHGADASGLKEFGAPNLRDAIWLYGKDYNTIYDVIYNGRAGVMPYWQGKLSDPTIRQLAIYVNQLSGGSD